MPTRRARRASEFGASLLCPITEFVEEEIAAAVEVNCVIFGDFSRLCPLLPARGSKWVALGDLDRLGGVVVDRFMTLPGPGMAAVMLGSPDPGWTAVKRVEPSGRGVNGKAVTPAGRPAIDIVFTPIGRVETSGMDVRIFELGDAPAIATPCLITPGPATLPGDTMTFLGKRDRRPGEVECWATIMTTGAGVMGKLGLLVSLAAVEDVTVVVMSGPLFLPEGTF